MALEHKPGTFSLFKNDKGGNEKRPDYRGEGKDMQGNDIEVAAWLRDGNKGKFMSCTFKPKSQDSRNESRSEPIKRRPDDDDSDLPF